MNQLLKSTLAVLFLLSCNTSFAQWSIMGSAGITGAVANYTDVAVDNNNVVYMAYADNANGDKLSVKKWTGSSWTSIGTALSNSSIQYVSMTIDPSTNDIYIAYKDWSVSGKLSVKKYNGSSWSTLGTGVSSSSVDYVSASVSPVSGKVYIAFKDNNQSGKASCMYYYNGSWYYLGGAGFTSSSVSYTSMVVTPSGYGYIAYRDNNNRPAMVQWTNYGWSSVGNPTYNGCSDVTIASDNNNVPYICYIDWNNSSKLTVQKYSGGNWSVVGSAGFTPNGTGTPEIAIDTNNNTPYVVYRDNQNNQKASVMKYSNGSWSNVGSAGFSANTVDYTSIAIDDNGALYVAFKDNAVSQKGTVMKYGGNGGGTGSGYTWTGNSSTDWNTASNWSGNTVPGNTDDVTIPSGKSRYPNLNSNSTYYYCKDLTIQSGASVTLNSSSAKLRVYGNISNSGTLVANYGRLEMYGSSAQTITSSTDIVLDEFRLNNSSGCTLSADVYIVDRYIPSNGTLTTNNRLTLKSTSSKTARIHKGSSNGGYINGNVTIQQYIAGGQRAYRFFSHPFSTDIPLSQLTDDIDITGPGGTTNGFTAVQVNAPSAFWFDVTTADTSTTGNNPGWKYFSSATTNSWKKYELARIMVRGAKGQGLTSGSYTPSAVTLDMTGPVNQGTQTISISKGSNSDFVICGNPFPSQVNLAYVSRTNVGSNFCVWDPRQGTYGGYTAYQFSNSFYLPAYSAFVAEATGSTATFVFQETDKVTSSPAGLFKGTAGPDPIEIIDTNYVVALSIEDNNIFWDRLLIEFDSASVATKDDRDMVKFYNPDLDFNTVTDDSIRASVDVRPYEYGKQIPLGLLAYTNMHLAIRAQEFSVPNGASLYLYDKMLNKSTQIKAGFEYWFDVDTLNPASFNDRFVINMGYANSITNINQPAYTSLTIAPNPASSIANISFSNLQQNAVLMIRDISGKPVYMQEVAKGTENITLPVQQLSAGMYIVELKNEHIRQTQKLIIR